ncbi:MAG: hypothetical protein V7756_12880 [Halopseudomonas sp.]|uniref:hypothetical protein n=1 Tax=Halopseudomonas sp. TaxID=2901191 RepID=UPI00300335A0
MNAQQQLVSVDDISEDNAPQIYVPDGLKPFIERVRSEVTGEVPDLSTKKGRDRVASLAAKVSKSKVAVEKPGRDYLKRLKDQPRIVEAELREFVNSMDALRDEVRKPLTDWEAKEAARVADFEERINELKLFAVVSDELSAAGIQVQISNLQAIDISESWQEFEAEAHRVKAASLEALQQLLTKRQAHEAQQAELERLREEQAAQAQREREAQLVREAEERARAEAAQAAQAERDAVIRREAESKAQSEARERQLQQQAEAAERERLASQQRAEQAEKDAAAKAEAAAAAERQRYLDEQKEIARQAAAREADVANKAKVNKAAMQAFMAGGMPEEYAKQAVVLIAKRQIPNVTISY